MKKKLFASILSIGLLLGFAPLAATATGSDSIYEINVNRSFVPLAAHPKVVQSSLLIPIRTLSSLGLSYEWEDASKTATVKNATGDVITVTLDSKTATKNGTAIEMAIPAQSDSGRVLVPIRFVSESLGYAVQYESIRNIIFVNSPDYKFDSSLLEQSDLAAARRAAISLPLTADFKLLPFGSKLFHSYRFPEGRADTYEFGDSYTNTVVRIENGQAKAVAQYVIGDRSNFSHKAGILTGTNTGDPVLQPFVMGVTFRHEPNTAKTGVYYWETDPETNLSNTKFLSFSTYKLYSDIIQPVPGNR